MTNALNEQLATITEAAYTLARSEKTIYRYLKTGLLKPVRIGGSTFIRRSDLKALMAGSSERSK